MHTTYATPTRQGTSAQPSAMDNPPVPLLRVEQSGRFAEIIVDTGHLLRSGRTWMAFARVPCANVFAARLLADNLRRRIAEAVADARREAYHEGYETAQAGARPRTHFSSEL